MAATGVTVSDDVISQFNEVKLGRTKAKFIIYKIEGAFRVGLSAGRHARWRADRARAGPPLGSCSRGPTSHEGGPLARSP